MCSQMSMVIVGVKSTAGRVVKYVDPSKTARSESAWLGYSLCDNNDTVYINTYHSHYVTTLCD